MLRKTWFHVVVLAVIIWVFYIWTPWLDSKRGAVGVVPAGEFVKVGRLSQEPEAANQDVFVCPCGGPGWCVGPRGGVYCVDINGKKKYRPKG